MTKNTRPSLAVSRNASLQPAIAGNTRCVPLTSLTLGAASPSSAGPHGPAALTTTLARIDKRSEEHTFELQSLMRIPYAVFSLKKKSTSIEPHNLTDEFVQHIIHHTDAPSVQGSTYTLALT